MSSKRHENQFTRNADASSNDEWDWRTDPDRWVKHRSRYLTRTTDFDSTDATIIAWAELGTSHSGIADEIDISRSATKARMSRIDEQFDCDCDSALWSRWPENIAVQSPVGIDGTVWGGDDDE
jgi:hypothetical protein